MDDDNYLFNITTEQDNLKTNLKKINLNVSPKTSSNDYIISSKNKSFSIKKKLNSFDSEINHRMLNSNGSFEMNEGALSTNISNDRLSIKQNRKRTVCLFLIIYPFILLTDLLNTTLYKV